MMLRKSNYRYNIRDSKGKFTKNPAGIFKRGNANLIGIWDVTDIVNESITITCKECGKLVSVLNRFVEDKGGLCTACYMNKVVDATKASLNT